VADARERAHNSTCSPKTEPRQYTHGDAHRNFCVRLRARWNLTHKATGWFRRIGTGLVAWCRFLKTHSGCCRRETYQTGAHTRYP
jgi:hypothetical protein